VETAGSLARPARPEHRIVLQVRQVIEAMVAHELQVDDGFDHTPVAKLGRALRRDEVFGKSLLDFQRVK
jgi:hypothetical protein